MSALSINKILMLPIGKYLKIGEVRSESGTKYRWNGTAWIPDGTGIADISDWPVVGIEEESAREDVVTGKQFVFRGGAWIPKVSESGGTTISESELNAMENYVEMEIGETFSENFRPAFIQVDGKAHINSANDGSSPYVGLVKGPATVGQTVRVYPVGVVKDLSGIAPKTTYQYRNVLEQSIGENFRMDEYNSNPQCAYVG